MANEECVYRKRGIPDDILYRKLIQRAFIIQNKDKKRIIDFLDRFYVEYYVRVVKFTEKDCEITVFCDSAAYRNGRD